MTLLVGPLTEGRAVGWPWWAWLMLAAVLPSAGVLAWWQRRLERAGRAPLVPPSLFGYRGMAVGLAVALPFFVAFGGFMFVYAVVAQGAGMSAIGTGLSLLPMAVAFLAASLVTGRLVPRLGSVVLTAGAVTGAVGYAGVGLAVAGAGQAFSVGDVLPAMLVVGIGNGVVMPPLFGIVLSRVPVHAGGLGSGVLITTQQMALGLGAAVVGSGFLTLVGQLPEPRAFALVAVALGVATLGVAAARHPAAAATVTHASGPGHPLPGGPARNAVPPASGGRAVARGLGGEDVGRVGARGLCLAVAVAVAPDLLDGRREPARRPQWLRRPSGSV